MYATQPLRDTVLPPDDLRYPQPEGESSVNAAQRGVRPQAARTDSIPPQTLQNAWPLQPMSLPLMSELARERSVWHNCACTTFSTARAWATVSAGAGVKWSAHGCDYSSCYDMRCACAASRFHTCTVLGRLGAAAAAADGATVFAQRHSSRASGGPLKLYLDRTV
jgi:hypothetical protein